MIVHKCKVLEIQISTLLKGGGPKVAQTTMHLINLLLEKLQIQLAQQDIIMYRELSKLIFLVKSVKRLRLLIFHKDKVNIHQQMK